MESSPLLSVENLRTVFENKLRTFPAVDGLSFDLDRGGVLGIVGESGSGKTMASLSIMRLLPAQSRTVEGSAIRFEGIDLVSLDEKEMCEVRGKDISMIFQDPMMSLDQVYTVGYQLVEAMTAHGRLERGAAKRRALELLGAVGIASPARVFDSYPFELSGGMCQRVMIAIALSCDPKLLIADEPTTALDVTVQAQILELLKKCRAEYGMGLIIITHDLDVVAEMAERIIVMYAGKAMEDAPKSVIFDRPRHPYTMGLIKSRPTIDTVDERLYSIVGTVPDIASMPAGCRFSTRCPLADARCVALDPPMVEFEFHHRVKCWKASGVEEGGVGHG